MEGTPELFDIDSIEPEIVDNGISWLFLPEIEPSDPGFIQIRVTDSIEVIVPQPLAHIAVNFYFQAQIEPILFIFQKLSRNSLAYGLYLYGFIHGQKQSSKALNGKGAIVDEVKLMPEPEGG